MRHLKLISALGVAGLLVAAGLAVAQTYPPPFVAFIHNNTDAVAVASNGTASAQSNFATPAQLNNVLGYVKITPATGSTACSASTGLGAGIGCAGYYNTFNASQTFMQVILTATMAYSYNYSAAAPSDGARECVVGSGGAITTFQFLPNTGSTIGTQVVTGGTGLTLASNSAACWTFSLSNLTWDRS